MMVSLQQGVFFFNVLKTLLSFFNFQKHFSIIKQIFFCGAHSQHLFKCGPTKNTSQFSLFRNPKLKTLFLKTLPNRHKTLILTSSGIDGRP